MWQEKKPEKLSYTGVMTCMILVGMIGYVYGYDYLEKLDFGHLLLIMLISTIVVHVYDSYRGAL